MSGRIVWVNGGLHAEHEAPISPFDHGLLTGDGVFETLTTYGGVPFAWTRHYRRLVRSAEGLGLDVPASDVLREATDRVIAANALAEARIRITITGGPSPLGSERGGRGCTAVVAATEPGEVAPTIDVVTAPWPRNQRGALAGLKTISYGENVRALAHARTRGGGEAVFANLDGHLCEGTGTNVWHVRGERLETPPLSAGCLDGVTRQVIIEILCPEVGIEVAETLVPVAALAEADEAFITSSTREAQAIARVDGRPLPAAPGPVTEKINTAFAGLVARDLDP